MAERLTPAYQRAQELLDTPLHGLDPEAKGKVALGKIAAQEVIDSVTPYLYPEDDDG